MSTLRGLAALLCLAMVSACGGSADTTTPAPPAVFGTLSVQVRGLDSAATDGGSVLATRIDGPPKPSETFAVPRGGVLAVSVPAGVYRITYSSPLGYRDGFDVNPSVVSVGENSTAAVRFSLQVIEASITLSAYFSGKIYPDSGGSATIVRTDVANGRDTTVTIPAEVDPGYYRITVSLPPGTYSITYLPPDGFDVLTGDGYFLSKGKATTSIEVISGDFEWLIFKVAAKSP